MYPGVPQQPVVSGAHGLGNTKVNENNLWSYEVLSLDHQISLLDVAMHHGMLVHERQRLEALPEQTPPPVWCH
jgi:hypothetical protein